MNKIFNKFLMALLVSLTLSSLSIAQTTRVLIVGDSWASQQIDDGVHNQVFIANGYANFIVDGNTTARSDTSTAEWAVADQLQVISDALSSQPNIDTVQLTIGGKDFYDNWSAAMTSQQETDLQQSILANITTIVNYILALNPKIEIILSFYDYPNFVDTISGFLGSECNNQYVAMNSPSPSVINTAYVQFEQVFAQLAVNNSRVYHVSHFGIMQAYFGSGGTLPPGNISSPSPVDSMRIILEVVKCYYYKTAANQKIVENLFDGYYHARFDTIYKSGFE